MSAEALSCEVLVVGAGPAGLTTGCALRQRGVDCLIVDALPEGLNTSRAAVVHARTLECLDGIGVAEELVSSGLALPKFRIRDRDRVLFDVDFSRLETTYPFALMIAQDRTEAILARRFEALGGRTARGCRLTALASDDRAAAATVVEDGRERTVTCGWVVGADGMHSVVRQLSDITFDGQAYDDSFLLADVRMAWPLGAGEVSLFFSPAGLMVVAPLPGGIHRIVATLEPAPSEPGVADVQALLDARGPGAGRIEEVIWGSRFRVQHRIAGRYRQGRVLLVGDAAHVHSPAGGQGMNVGLRDAVALADMLDRVLRHGAPVDALDGYEAARRPDAERVLRLSARLTRAATLEGAPARAARNALLRLAGSSAAIRSRIAAQLSGVGL